MALLLDRWSANQPPGIVAADLAATAARIEAMQQHPIPAGSFEISAYRAWLEEYSRLVSKDCKPHTIPVSNRTFASPMGAVGARIYTPRHHRSVIVFVHGGGWVIGSVNTHDHICRWLAKATESKVISVDYGLAPEHPYPAAVAQTAAVLSAVLHENEGEQHSVFVAGDSAGATVGAMAVLDCGCELAERVDGFISIYGAYSPHLNLSSHRLYGDGRFGLSQSQMQWFWNLYAPHIQPAERDKLTPLGLDLRFFPPTLCIGAECDLLLDDTIGFYSSLAKAGIDVSLSLWPGITHGALHFVEVVESVTSAARVIARYVEERRREPGDTFGTPTMAHVLQPTPTDSLAPTVMASAEAPPSGWKAVAAPQIESVFLTSRLRQHGSIAHRLGAKIVGGDLGEGGLLPNEDNASASYGVSRSAYREAIRTLAAKGLVTATPKVGTRVAPRSAWRLLDPDVITWHLEAEYTAAFVSNLFELRKVIEPSAAALTATRRDEEAVSRLADALARMARHSPKDRGWHDALLDFHRCVLQSCGNEVLAATWPPVQVILQWSLNLQLVQPGPGRTGDPVADHAKVLENIACQNPEGALREMAFLIDAALAETMSVFTSAARRESLSDPT